MELTEVSRKIILVFGFRRPNPDPEPHAGAYTHTPSTRHLEGLVDRIQVNRNSRLGSLKDTLGARDGVGGCSGLSQEDGRVWGWTLWEHKVPLPKATMYPQKFRVCAKAVDMSYNVQPESPVPLINNRGFGCNCWHCIEIVCPPKQ